MSQANQAVGLRHLLGLIESGTIAGLSDAQLLERYVAYRDERAFAVLVKRHGPMVLSVCKATLAGSPEVEDAFQATFLVLIRKAPTIRGQQAVGGWLHRVAQRVAVQAAVARSRTSVREGQGSDLSARIAIAAAAPDDDWRGPLHEEVARLPE